MVARALIATIGWFALTVNGALGAEQFIPLLGPGDAIPPIPLVTQDGQTFTLANLRGRALVISFITTRCRDARMCPLVAAKFAQAQATIGHAPIHLIIVSLDPRYDTPAILTHYGRVFGQDRRYWTLATGSPRLVDEFTQRLGITTQAGQPGSPIHTEAAVIVAPDGRIARTIFGTAWTPAELIDDARATFGQGDDPRRTLRAWLGSALERCGSAGIALRGDAMLGVFTLVGTAVGAAFWLAFRRSWPDHG